jgi:hypothetical protein
MQLHPTDYTPALLAASVAKLPEGQQDFALSLLAAWQGRGLSEKQRVWVMKLIDKAQGVAPVRLSQSAAQVGDIAPIVSLIRGAGRNLKRPALLIATDGPDTLRITIAGPASREPGSLNVTTTTRGADGRYGWIGRITQHRGVPAWPGPDPERGAERDPRAGRLRRRPGWGRRRVRQAGPGLAASAPAP